MALSIGVDAARAMERRSFLRRPQRFGRLTARNHSKQPTLQAAGRYRIPSRSSLAAKWRSEFVVHLFTRRIPIFAGDAPSTTSPGTVEPTIRPRARSDAGVSY